MLTVEQCETLMADCRAKEEAAFEAAVHALRAVIEAHCGSLNARRLLQEAQGGKPPPDPDTGILTLRAQRGCPTIIRRALRVGVLARLGF